MRTACLLLGRFGVIATLLFIQLGCANDDDMTPYPDLVTEMCDLPTDGDGFACRLHPDSGGEFLLTNPRSGLIAHATYRLLCGYTVSADETCLSATLYSLRSVVLLRDSTERERDTDPVRVQSVWRSKSYINLRMLPRTQGGKHYWGYRVDSLCARYGVPHLYLSLYHNQNGDIPAYTSTEFASLQLDKLWQIVPGDSVTINVHSEDGVRSWPFEY